MASNAIKKKFLQELIRWGRQAVDRILKNKREVPTSDPRPAPTPTPAPEADEDKTHPWRACPIGEHWVRTHPLKVPVSDRNPEGMTLRDGHCHRNPPRKKDAPVEDYLERDEIYLISQTYFGSLVGPPKAGVLKRFNQADDYDVLIRGWTRYWNDIFQPATPLEPDLVKALIASESSFELKPPDQNAKTAGAARGLIQLTDQAIKALGNPKGELKNHFVRMTADDASDANVSICAGTRWLFRKRDLASRKLKRTATWMEAIAEYKGDLNDMMSNPKLNPQGMQNVRKFYEALKK
jgi:hypothetical protein